MCKRQIESISIWVSLQKDGTACECRNRLNQVKSWRALAAGSKHSASICLTWQAVLQLPTEYGSGPRFYCRNVQDADTANLFSKCFSCKICCLHQHLAKARTPKWSHKRSCSNNPSCTLCATLPHLIPLNVYWEETNHYHCIN